MAASDAAIIDVESDEKSDPADAQLQFQDFGDDGDLSSDKYQGSRPQTHMFTSFPDSADDDTEHSDLLGEEKKAPAIWSFEYYQSFFNVDTHDVLRRITWSMIPRPGYSYLQYHIRPNPDLYGPFWVCTTLIFTTAIMGNIANYLKTANQGDYIWHYDFHKVTLAATTIYAYASIVPLLLWAILWYRRSEAQCTFLEILCVYGYSLSIYIPISVLWTIQIELLQWLLVVVGSILSGTVLLMTFWPTVKNEQKQIAALILLFMVALHFLLAIGFLLYFFHVPDVETKGADVSPIASSTTKSETVDIVSGKSPGALSQHKYVTTLASSTLTTTVAQLQAALTTVANNLTRHAA